jgi:hypothetical protein
MSSLSKRQHVDLIALCGCNKIRNPLTIGFYEVPCNEEDLPILKRLATRRSKLDILDKSKSVRDLPAYIFSASYALNQQTKGWHAYVLFKRKSC